MFGWGLGSPFYNYKMLRSNPLAENQGAFPENDVEFFRMKRGSYFKKGNLSSNKHFNERRLHTRVFSDSRKVLPCHIGGAIASQGWCIFLLNEERFRTPESSKSKGRLGSRLCFFSNYAPPKIWVSHYYSQSSFLRWCQFSILFLGWLHFPWI